MGSGLRIDRSNDTKESGFRDNGLQSVAQAGGDADDPKEEGGEGVADEERGAGGDPAREKRRCSAGVGERRDVV